MGLYGRCLLPHLINLAMRDKAATAERARYVPLARGTVLEGGAGSALNLPFYGSEVERLVAIELGRKRVAAVRFPVEAVTVSAESIPVPDSTFDTVVLTWTLCSIAREGARGNRAGAQADRSADLR